MKSKDRNTKISDENNEFDVFVSYEESEPDISSKTKRKTPNKYCEWIKKIISNNVKGISLIAVLPIIATVVGNYISQQRYYDELLGKYLELMEKYLIQDKLYVNYLEMDHIEKEHLNTNDEEKKKDFQKDFQQRQAEFLQARNLARSTTENMLRSFSRNDGICLPINSFPITIETFPGNNEYLMINPCIPGTTKNPERRQLLLSFLSEAGLGFKNIVDGTIPKEPSQSFLEGIYLGSLQNNKGLNLEEINLSRAILRNANLIYANLIGANLTSADLTSSRLHYAILPSAYLTDANLTDARLDYANLEKARFIDANLKRANLTRANLQGADLTRANLKDADLTRANLKDADLTDANLKDAKLCNTILPNGKISDCPKNE
ncbi:pentapeptide repeat-containing protein [Anabaena subtropica]|uniref:Pentapeptide repeat-containing protein n=1 Tax=Anabaena subtropica FACHB-260 TaxID=2692884 RepID=A0ABR8CNM5_9NOST|nr:pentapeptide repeat-containing protein [Anabaena subtropica]MBD2344396.1 pentapeptide repeat-containing protein [Anabaena subtropica FACHB-260]